MCEGGEGAKEQVTGVGHDGRAARGNTVLRLETKEAGKEVVDGNGRFEFGEAGDEFGGQAGDFVSLLLAAGMLGAEGGERIRDGHTAAALGKHGRGESADEGKTESLIEEPKAPGAKPAPGAPGRALFSCSHEFLKEAERSRLSPNPPTPRQVGV